MRINKIILIILGLIIASTTQLCATSNDKNISSAAVNYTKEDLLSAPKEIAIDNNSYIFNVLIHKDFMPPGHYTNCIVYIYAKDLKQFPQTVDADLLWGIDKNQIWNTNLKEIKRSKSDLSKQDNVLEKSTPLNTPDWFNPNINIVIRLIDKKNNNTYLLKVSEIGGFTTH